MSREEDIKSLTYFLKIEPIVIKHKKRLLKMLLGVASEITPDDYYLLKEYARAINLLIEPFQPCMNDIGDQTKWIINIAMGKIVAFNLLRRILIIPSKGLTDEKVFNCDRTTI